jgi:hypothetical protein
MRLTSCGRWSGWIYTLCGWAAIGWFVASARWAILGLPTAWLAGYMAAGYDGFCGLDSLRRLIDRERITTSVAVAFVLVVGLVPVVLSLSYLHGRLRDASIPPDWLPSLVLLVIVQAGADLFFFFGVRVWRWRLRCP